MKTIVDDEYFSTGEWWGFRWSLSDTYPGSWLVTSLWAAENFRAVVDDFGDLVRVEK